MNSKGIVSRDTRGRKIVSEKKAKNELISSFILFLLVFFTIRLIVVSFYKLPVENFLIGSIILGFTDAICLALAWIATFKISMKKYAIKETGKRLIKSSFMMINICVIIFYSVYMIYSANETINDVRNEYLSIIESYNGIIDEELKNQYINEVELAIGNAKSKLYTMTFIELTLGICGMFWGCSFIRREIENLGIDEEEFNLCTTTNLKENVAI